MNITPFIGVFILGGIMKKLRFFHAKWCPPCRNMNATVIMPLLEKYANKIEVIDVNKKTSVAEKYKVDKIPAFIILDNEREIWREHGKQEIDEIEKRIHDD